MHFADALSSLFKVGVIHFCDHNSYLRYFAFRYGFCFFVALILVLGVWFM